MNLAELPGGEAALVDWATAAPYLAALSPVALAIWMCVVVRRARLVRDALADRVTVEVVPTNSFDPSESGIVRWVGQLSHVRQVAKGVPARGAAVRVRYSAESRKMHCYLEGPSQAAALLAMPSFTDVEVIAHGSRQSIQPVRFTTPAEPEGTK
ncbi:hypothetical protein [Streptomyces sp. NPDC005407]|uniref:hypothetical protein n=1 Tax=Streptomyces sp. NPDC005407 TaxID=3155340 RepID=UPI0033A3DEB8